MKISVAVNEGARVVRRYALGVGSHSVGSAGCVVNLKYPTVSRRHGRIVVGDGEVYYADERSRNGSFLKQAGSAITASPVGEAQCLWPQGTRLSIGPFELSWAPDTGENIAELDLVANARELGALYARALAENPAGARDQLFEAAEARAGRSELRDQLLELVHRELHGDGPLKPYLENPCCKEVLANAFDELFVDLGDGPRRLDAAFFSRETFEAWAARTAHQAGRRLDLQHPICEATLASGARFHAVLPPVSARGISVAIRRFGSAPVDEQQALGCGWLDATALAIIKDAVTLKKNIVISGGTSTGKTSLLNFLCRYLPDTERILTVEDTVELAPPVKNLVQLQARHANADGVGEVSLRQLVQCALRMRPDRILVGECRGAEVLDMLQALNTGHPGSLTTVHANSAAEALHRLELLALLGAPNLSVECIRAWISQSVDVVVQLERDSTGHRHVSEISTRSGHAHNVVYRRAPGEMASG